MNAYERNSNIDALITLSAHVLEVEDLETMRGADVSDVEIPHRLYRKIMRRIRKHDRQTEMSKAYIFVRRIVAVFLIVCTISLALCLSVEAIRGEIWRIILEWHEKYIEVQIGVEKQYLNEIKEYKQPTLQPVGTTEEVLNQNWVSYTIAYSKDDAMLIYQMSLLTDGYNVELDNTGCTISKIEINGCEGELFVYENGCSTLMWYDNEYVYFLINYIPNLSVEVLKMMAESVK